ncbi:cystathionine beta-lyase PatB [Oxobacter pfennigii]|uniref:cysteine-S-conjugate beta-lyase n=1 Tax=Oxobacter pfennigii TaxID=36849 RepID=A0A0P9AE89_9CLOT|nr:MalY/PatB family protein [Oxobacter pfennigii]KPU43607.1 cystathionine beta-lyase PatB [Oxobacter pfennigii]
MKYDFDKVIQRQGTSSLKWDYAGERFGNKDLLPLWVADMDFESPEPVVDAVKKRASHGIYGYTGRSMSCHESIINWMKKRHGWGIKMDWLTYTPGVVPALSIAILAFTNPGDKIIVQTPVYYPFFSVIKNNGRQILDNELKLVDGKYTMDFDDLEEKIDSSVKMLILCSPHNPVGRVWSKEELKRLAKICVEKDIIIISDEIHSDIIFKGSRHIPIAALSEEIADRTITCIAPSKTFNIAGLSASVAIISNKGLKKNFDNIVEGLGIASGNVFGITAMEAAYTHGEEWLSELLNYLEDNMNYVKEYIDENIPEIKVDKVEGTYLLWLNCKGLNLSQDELKKFMYGTAGVALNDGTTFGKSGEGYMRMNIGCPRVYLVEGLKRIETAVRGVRK